MVTGDRQTDSARRDATGTPARWKYGIQGATHNGRVGIEREVTPLTRASLDALKMGCALFLRRQTGRYCSPLDRWYPHHARMPAREPRPPQLLPVWRRSPARRAGDAVLLGEIEAIAGDFPVYGYRRITHALQRCGTVVNHRRVTRLMREGRRFPARVRKYCERPAAH